MDKIIEGLDQELSEIAESVDASIKTANYHIQKRLLNGEAESDVSCTSSSKTSVKSKETNLSGNISTKLSNRSVHELQQQ